MAYYVMGNLEPVVIKTTRSGKTMGTQNQGAGSTPPTTGQIFPRGKT